MCLLPLLPLQNVFEKIKVFPLGHSIINFLMTAMLIGWIVRPKDVTRPGWTKSSFNVLFILYIIYLYFSLWQGSFHFGLDSPISASDLRVQFWKNYCLLPILFLVTLNNIHNKKDIFIILAGLVLTFVVIDLYTVQQVQLATSWFSRTKIHGTFEWLGPNEVAGFYAMYTFIFLGLLLYIKQRFVQLVLLALVGTNLFCVLFLYSRGAYLAVITGIIFIGLVSKRILLVLVFILFLFWQFIIPKSVIDRLAYSEVQGELDESAAQRLNYWNIAWAQFRGSPVVGVGLNTINTVNSDRDTHSLYLRTLAEQGAVGFLFLLWIMLLAFQRGWALFKRAKDPFFAGLGLGFCACVLAAAVANLFGDRWTYLPVGAFFWVFMAMVERGNRIEEEGIVLEKGQE